MKPNTLLFFKLSFFFSLFFLSACGNQTSKEGSSSPDDIHSSDCTFFDKKDMPRYIKMADLPCVKKALEEGMDPNSKVADFGRNTEIPLMLHAFDNSSLFFASSKYSSDIIVALLLKYGADPNTIFEGRTYLSRLLEYDYIKYKDILKTFIQFEKTNVNLLNNKQSPLQKSIALQNEEVIKLLIDRGANVNLYTSFNEAPLIQALRYKLENSVTHILNAGAKVQIQDSDGLTPLHIAVSNRLEKSFDLLIQKNAILDQQNALGETPLYLAVANGSDSIALKLISLETDILAKTKSQETVLMKAASGSAGIPVLESILKENMENINAENAEKNTALHVVADAAKLELLLKAGADINVENIQGQTPLSIKVKASDTRSVEILLKNFANTSWKSVNEDTLLHQAVGNDNLEIATMLITQNEELKTLKNKNGQSPLFYVSSSQMLRFLVAQGMDINALDYKNNPALFYKIENELSNELLETFINLKVDIKWKDPKGNTYLHILTKHLNLYGSHYDYTDRIRILLKAGVLPNELNSEIGGRAAIHYIRSPELLQVFKDEGANLDVESKMGETLLKMIDKEILILMEEIKEAELAGNATELDRIKQENQPLIKVREKLKKILE